MNDASTTDPVRPARSGTNVADGVFLPPAPSLGGYPARRCPRVVHNQFSPHVPDAPQPTVEQQQIFSDGEAFEARVVEALRTVPGVLVLSDRDGVHGNQQATMAAMNDQVPVIVGGRLPEVSGRTGAPDVLVRTGDGYLPIEIKNHSVGKVDPERKKPAPYALAPLTDPTRLLDVARFVPNSNHRVSDGMQLAHYLRMLEDLGQLPSPTDDDPQRAARGGVIGTNRHHAELPEPITDTEFWVVWHTLGEPTEQTYSATAAKNRRRRSLLERYDHEFAFRRKVAQVARDGGEIVVPIYQGECDNCVWKQHCHGVAGETDPSFAVQHGPLDARQWRFLRDRGVGTLEDLAALPLIYTGDKRADRAAIADALGDEFAAEWARHSVKQGSEGKLPLLARRAQMLLAGVPYEPIAGEWPTVPSTDVEIDFDIEWDKDGRVYQWGVRVREGQDDTTAEYLPGLVSFEPLDAASELALAEKFADALSTIVAQAEQDGTSVQIYHWSSAEVSRTQHLPPVRELLERHTFDLCAWFSKHFVAVSGSSIKTVAPIFDFSWTVEGAGGNHSLDMIEEARRDGPGSDAATWLLKYNESDVAAQAKIRDGLRRDAVRRSTSWAADGYAGSPEAPHASSAARQR